MLVCPMHSRAFQARFHHQFIATFDHAAANRPALSLELGILHLGFPFFQISQVARHSLFIRMLLLQVPKLGQQSSWAFMFEPM